MVKWFIWNRIDYLYENGFGFKQPKKVGVQYNPIKQPTVDIE